MLSRPPGYFDVNEHETPEIFNVNFDASSYNEQYLERYTLVESDLKVSIYVFTNYKNNTLLNILKECYKLHSLTLEDIVNTHQRSKYEIYETYELCILQKYLNGEKTQVSLIITGNTLLIFTEKEDNSINEVIRSIKHSSGRIRERDVGYCGYAFLDCLIDSYFVELERIENIVEILDDSIEEGNNISKEIFKAKKKVLEFKKNTWPIREFANSLLRNEKSRFVNDERNKFFLRDLQDHIYRITESADALRDNTFSLVEMHANHMSMKMNEIMKVLTVITTIFVPITFLSSIYGMNFEGMQEIHWTHGYAIFWCIVFLTSFSLFFYFRKKRWI